MPAGIASSTNWPERRLLDEERRHLVGEVADGHRRRAVVADLGDVDAHPGSGVAVAVVGDPQGGADFLEAAVAAVAEGEVAHRVVGDDQVEAAILVEVGEGHAERLGGRLARDRVGDDQP